jgi:hypothetical protein
MKMPNRKPDYYTFSVSEGIGVGATENIIIDQNGNIYISAGLEVGKSPLVTGSLVAGWLDTDMSASPKELGR